MQTRTPTIRPRQRYYSPRPRRQIPSLQQNPTTRIVQVFAFDATAHNPLCLKYQMLATAPMATVIQRRRQQRRHAQTIAIQI
jgi:hypothetical protein